MSESELEVLGLIPWTFWLPVGLVIWFLGAYHLWIRPKGKDGSTDGAPWWWWQALLWPLFAVAWMFRHTILAATRDVLDEINKRREYARAYRRNNASAQDQTE